MTRLEWLHLVLKEWRADVKRQGTDVQVSHFFIGMADYRELKDEQRDLLPEGVVATINDIKVGGFTIQEGSFTYGVTIGATRTIRRFGHEAYDAREA